MSDDEKYDTKNLDNLIKAFKDNLSRARVGVLGSKVTRGTDKSAGLNNATIGAMHEFGTSKLPVRSFLRVPISDNLENRMESAGAFNKEELDEVVKTASFVPWLKKVAILAEGIVADAFSSNGFGKWKPTKHVNGGNTTLVDTGQLRDSITSEVK